MNYGTFYTPYICCHVFCIVLEGARLGQHRPISPLRSFRSLTPLLHSTEGTHHLHSSIVGEGVEEDSQEEQDEEE